jgi:hypothetical protein
MREQWGPWIEHDGGQPDFRGFPPGSEVEFEMDDAGPGWLGHPPGQFTSVTAPNWYWRWRRIGGVLGFFRRTVRVCDAPDFMPIVRYRFRRPSGEAALAQLRQIARGARPVDVPAREREGAEA